MMVQQRAVVFGADGQREDEHVGEVQAAVVARELEVVGEPFDTFPVKPRAVRQQRVLPEGSNRGFQVQAAGHRYRGSS